MRELIFVVSVIWCLFCTRNHNETTISFHTGHQEASDDRDMRYALMRQKKVRGGGGEQSLALCKQECSLFITQTLVLWIGRGSGFYLEAVSWKMYKRTEKKKKIQTLICAHMCMWACVCAHTHAHNSANVNGILFEFETLLPICIYFRIIFDLIKTSLLSAGIHV